MTDWRARARAIAVEERVSPDLFEKLVMAESSGNPNARSPVGASGLAQLMPGTAADLGVDPSDPEQNLRGGARYLRQQMDRFQSTPLALAAYNAGPGRVAKAGGIPRIAETEDYVKKIAGDPSLQSGADIFELDSPAAPAAATPAPPSIRRGDDGAIEIDINEGRGGPDLSLGEDIFADAEVTTPGAAPIAPPQAAGEASSHSDEMLGFLKGLMKPLDNAAKAVEMIPGIRSLDKKISETFGVPTTDEVIGARPAAFAAEGARRNVKPGAIGRVIGEILGAAPTAMLPGGVIAQGAASGALLTDRSDLRGVAGDALTGAVTGKVSEAGLNSLGKVLSPRVRPLVERLKAAGVNLTPGQILGGGARSIEDKLQSLPIAGGAVRAARERGIDSFNRAAVNRTLGPIGKTLPEHVATGHDAVKFAEDALGDAYDALLPNLTVTPDAQLAAGLKSLGPQIQALPAPRQKQLKTILDQAVSKLGRTGPVGGKEFKAVESDLSTFVRRYGATPDGDQQAMASVVADFRDELRDLLTRQNPNAAAELKAINTGYANLVRVQAAAGRSSAPEGIFSASGLNSAVRAGASGVRKKSMSKGEALMQDLSGAGKSVLPDSVPNTGSADRLMSGDLISNLTGLLASLPVIPLYSEPVQKALVPLLTARPAAARALAKALPGLKRPVVAASSAAAVNARQ